jgi:hypothetical protein
LKGERQKGQYYNPDDIPEINQRSIYNEYDRSGSALKGERHKGQYYDPDDIPEINQRSIYNEYDRSGTALKGEKHKGQYYDPKDIPEMNQRSIYNKYDRSGTAIKGDKQRGQYYNPEDIPELTMRNTYNHNDVGQIKGLVDSSYTVKYDDIVPDATQRNTYNYNDVGQAKHEIDAGYVINYDNWTPALTEREIIGETNYTGPGQHELIKQRTRNDAYNSTVNTTREVVSKNRAPTGLKYDEGPTKKYTTFSLKNDKNNKNWNILPSQQISSLDRLPINVVKNKNEKYHNNVRLNSYAKEVLEGNPFVNEQMYL